MYLSIYTVLLLFLPTLHAMPLDNATDPTTIVAISSPLTVNGHLGLPGGLYSCTEPQWKGACHWYHPDKTNKCHIVPSTEYRYRSWGPDKGGNCKLFQSTDCDENTRYYMPDRPHDGGDIWKYPGWYTESSNVQIKSVWCWTCDGC